MKYLQFSAGQQGAALIVGLIMLLLLTLMVTAAFTLSGVNLKAVGNMQSRAEAAAAANAVIESVISSDAIFRNPQNKAVLEAPYTVGVAAPVCIRAIPVKTNSSNDAYPNIYIDGQSGQGADTGFKNTYWNIKATVDDVVSGAKVVVNQGVRITLPANPNPCP
ncbi:hypothetical protein D3C78_1321080 [compost metagenome]